MHPAGVRKVQNPDIIMTKPAERFLIFFIRAYQHTVGMLIPRVCRYEPTCSQYAIEAIREHGVFRGLVLSAWRIMRCNPWCQGGYDPVPSAGGRK